MRIIKNCLDDPARCPKLLDEIEFILRLPNDLKWRFPQIQGYSLDPPRVTLEHYPYPSLRSAIFAQQLSTQATLSCLEAVLDFVINDLFFLRHSPASQRVRRELLETVHIRRAEERMEETRTALQAMREPPGLSPRKEYLAVCLENLLAADFVVVNDSRLLNLRQCLNKIMGSRHLSSSLVGKELGVIHGDLHLENILANPADPSDFILLDPRGFRALGDLAYDLGKLLHSVSGLYDFIHQGFFDLEVIPDNASELRIYFSTKRVAQVSEAVSGGGSGAGLERVFGLGYATQVFQEIHEKLPALLMKHELVHSDSTWRMRSRFAEAMHFCTMVPFHCSQSLARGIVLYVKGLELLNKFLMEYA